MTSEEDAILRNPISCIKYTTEKAKNIAKLFKRKIVSESYKCNPKTIQEALLSSELDTIACAILDSRNQISIEGILRYKSIIIGFEYFEAVLIYALISRNLEVNESSLYICIENKFKYLFSHMLAKHQIVDDTPYILKCLSVCADEIGSTLLLARDIVNINVAKSSTMLHRCISSKCFSMAKTIIASKIQLHDTDVRMVINSARSDLLNILIEEGNCDLSKEYDGKTLLHRLCLEKNEALAIRLIKHREVDVNVAHLDVYPIQICIDRGLDLLLYELLLRKPKLSEMVVMSAMNQVKFVEEILCCFNLAELSQKGVHYIVKKFYMNSKVMKIIMPWLQFCAFNTDIVQLIEEHSLQTYFTSKQHSMYHEIKCPKENAAIDIGFECVICFDKTEKLFSYGCCHVYPFHESCFLKVAVCPMCRADKPQEMNLVKTLI